MNKPLLYAGMNGRKREWAWITAVLMYAPPALAQTSRPTDTDIAVEVEEQVTAFTNADNGAGPTWCYGAPLFVRVGKTVYASAIETGKDVPPLCNTRWQLWRRDDAGWKLAQHEAEYRQREPCPIARLPGQGVFLSANPSTQPPGTKYGPCKPTVLRFDIDHPETSPVVEEPVFPADANFTDHSYRGFAADAERGELLLLNIDAASGVYHLAWRDSKGAWFNRGRIAFPIRACYPQVVLTGGGAHVLAIGDIVEPRQEWRKLKFEKLQSQWDYVFRRLFYTCTPDLAKTPFIAPVEVDTVEETAGSISNLDMHVDRQGTVHVLYIRRPHQYDFIRDKYFPGQPMTTQLMHVTLKDGKVIRRVNLSEGRPGQAQQIVPGFARFRADVAGRIFVILAASGIDDDKPSLGNFLGKLDEAGRIDRWRRISLEHPFRTFFTNTVRGGSAPGATVDLYGTTDEPQTLRYACIRLR